MPLINCKIKLNLTWKKNVYYQLMLVMQYLLLMTQKCMFQSLLCQKKITKILLNKKFILLNKKGFQRSVYWNEYKTIGVTENADANNFKYISLDPSFQGVNRLFVMAYNSANDQPTRNGQQKYYLPRNDLNKYNVIIDGRNFYDNPIESDIEKYRELKTVMVGKGEDYTTGSLLDFNYFKEQFNKLNLNICLEQIQLFIGY